MDVKVRSVAASPPSGKATDERKWKRSHEGLVGLVNIGNSCYMNAALQALSNCPSFRQFFVECYHPLPSPGATHSHTHSTQRAADVLTAIFKKMWTSDKPPGHLSPRMVSSAMRIKTFHSSLQQDSQEFLRCLLMQIHDETAVEVPPWSGGVAIGGSRDTPQTGLNPRRDSMVSSTSHDSEIGVLQNDRGSPLSSLAPDPGRTQQCKSSPLPRKKGLARLSLKQKSAGSSQSLSQSSPTNHRRFALRGSSSLGKGRSGPREVEEGGRSLGQTGGSQVSLESQSSSEEEGERKRDNGDVYEVDLVTRRVTLHQDCHLFDLPRPPPIGKEAMPPGDGHTRVGGRSAEQPSSSLTPVTRQRRATAKPKLRSIVTEVFEGVLESRVKCGSCKKVSVVHESFQDLSLPIPGRKEMAKSQQRVQREPSELAPTSLGGGGGGGGGVGRTSGSSSSGGGLSRGLCTVISLMSQVRDMFSGPETNLHDCLDAFFDPSELKGGNQYYCSQCRKFQNSQKEMIITKLPEVLCIHLKRFRFDAYFSSKISRHIAFPMLDLDMEPYLKESARAGQNCNYELCAVITHYGGAGGGHYVAFAKNSSHNAWFEFNDTRVTQVTPDTVVNSEGYVLFYKRVPPSNSASLQNIELSSLLLPRPGSLPGDPNPVVYLSRHWLHLLRTCSNPGPIFQHEFACEHGAVLPHRMEHARPLAMAVRRDVWETYHHRYGGGPLVQKLEVCSVCRALLDSYSERRKKEREDIHKLQSAGHSQLERRETFLLSQQWLSQWQSFINCTSLVVGPPGPVDNSNLIQEVQSEQKSSSSPQLRLVPDTGASLAYHKLSWGTWSYIIRTYGGGPVVTSSMSPPPSLPH